MECAEILGMGLGGARPPPHKKKLEMACFGAFSVVFFVRVLGRKC